MKGLLLYTNLTGTFPDEPAFRPVFRRAAGYAGRGCRESYFGDVLDLQRRGLDYLRQLAVEGGTG